MIATRAPNDHAFYQFDLSTSSPKPSNATE